MSEDTPAREDADAETSSEGYAQRFSGAAGSWMLQVQERIVLDLLRGFPKATVLDVGGGHAQLAAPLAAAGHRVTVFGSDPVCAARLQPLIAAGTVRFRHGDLLALPFEAAAFEVVVSIRLLPHCRAWPELIAGLCRVARQAVLVDYPTSQSLNAFSGALFGVKKKIEGNTRPFRLFRHDEVKDVFRRHGCRETARRPEFFWPMVLHRALRSARVSAAAERAASAVGLTARWGSPVLALFTKEGGPAVTRFQQVFPAGARVLVTGATGFTGSHLIRKLAESGARVRAIARPSSGTDAFRDLPVEWVRGQVYEPDAVAAGLRGVEYVFHVAAAYREAGLSDDVYRQVHVDSTRLLAQAAVAQPGFRRFVHISTVGVHGHIETPPADETAPFHPGDIYQRTKADAEQWLHEFARARGLPYTVIRPAAIYGPGDRRLLKIFKMAARPVFLLLGRSRGLYHLIHVDDLTDAMGLAATHPAAQGEAFICGSPEAVTLERMGRTIAEALGRRFRVVRLPVGPFFAAAAVCEAVCRPLGLAPPIYRRRVAFFTKDRSFDTRKIRERLGFACAHRDEDGLRETALWYREKGWI